MSPRNTWEGFYRIQRWQVFKEERLARLQFKKTMDNVHYKLLDKSSKKVLGKNTQIQPTSHASGNYRVDANVLRIDMMLGSPAHIEVGVSSRTRHTSSNDPGANILALVLITTFTITRYHQTAKIREEMENRLDYTSLS